MRLYLTPSEVSNTEIGITLASQIAALPSDAQVSLLARASQRIDTFCQRRLQAIGSTTIGTGGVAVGATVIPLASTLTLDQKDEQALVLSAGLANQEVLTIVPGTVVATTPLVAPYPGSVTVSSPCQFSHPEGDPVQGVYIETRISGSSSTSDVYETVVSQQAQIAAAHAGGYNFLNSERTRYHWLDQAPLVSTPLIPTGILHMEHAYPYTNEFFDVEIPALLLEPHIARVKFPVGTFILSGGLLRTTYLAGYQTIPDDVKDAVAYFLAGILAFSSNPSGAMQVQMGKRNIRYFIDPKTGKTQYELQAENILCLGNYKR